MSGRFSGAAFGARGSIWSAVCRTSARPGGRCFSTSSSRQATHVVSFTETSSPQLDDVLAEIRTKIILPSYIRIEQRKKLYDARYKKKLEVDPVTMELDGQILKFYYTDPVREMPNTRELLLRAVNQMKTPQDWENLPRLLEGVCGQAGRKLEYYDYPRLIRKAALHGCLRTIFVCIRQVKRTHFRLGSSETVNELLSWVQKQAIDSGRERAATEEALAWTERIILSLEDEAHHPVRKRGDEGKDPKSYPLCRDPQILAARLHMASALALLPPPASDGAEDGESAATQRRQEDDEARRRKVTKYTREIVALWPEGKGLMELHTPEAYQTRGELRYLLDSNEFLWYAAPVLKGLETAAQVVEPALAEELQKRIAPLREEIDAALADENRVKGRRGEQMYNDLFA
ncbi:hypothetical protein VTK73DRAFT_8098 [Phialemonium thermophilum]|uniref:Uncharacterized protein n=1 Tax=Phialemonium thermophilum TaxID=223376 RepID=A0ABR3WAK2_9PEZI